MSINSGDDSPLSVTGSIVGIVGLIISLSTIVQALFIYFTAFRDAPKELKRYTASVSNTIDEKSHRLREGHVPGPIGLELGSNSYNKGRWAEMLEEYYYAHLELEDELDKIKRSQSETNSGLNLTRLFWIFRRKDLEESVRRVETLRMRKMAVALNALLADLSAVKETLQRLESRIPEGPIRLPPARPPQDENPDLPQPLRMYANSVLGESAVDIVRTSLDSR